MNVSHPMPDVVWVFPAQYVQAIDGDTIDVVLDQGMHNRRHERLRLLGVNAPERKTTTRKAGDEAHVYVLNWLNDSLPWQEEWPLIVETRKADAFGRYLALVWRTVDGACLNDDLVTSGHAVVDIRP